MRISHKVDYGVRAAVALARILRDQPDHLVKAERLVEAEAIPPRFLDGILRDLRAAGLLRSQRGPDGGWALARRAEEITVADVIRALEGPLASVRGIRPHELAADGVQEPFVSLWVAVRTSLRSVLEAVTLAELAEGRLPDQLTELTRRPGAFEEH